MMTLSLIRHLELRALSAFAAVMLLPVQASSDDTSHRIAPASDDPALRKATAVLERLSQLSRVQGIADAPSLGALSKAVFYPQLGRARNLKSFQILTAETNPVGKPLYWWIKLSESGERVHQITFIPPNAPRSTLHTAKWPKETAVKVAEDFMSVLVPHSKLNLKAIQVEFVQHINHRFDPEFYVNGYWRLSFQRFSAKGYAVFKDTISIEVDEDHGLRSYLNDCLTDADEDKIGSPVFPVDKAKAHATEYAKKVLAEGPAVKGYYGEFLLGESPNQPELLVVRPNELLNCKDFHDFKEESHGVLAWVFTFTLTHPSNKLTPGVLRIYIDAVSGKFVGGGC